MILSIRFWSCQKISAGHTRPTTPGGPANLRKASTQQLVFFNIRTRHNGHHHNALAFCQALLLTCDFKLQGGEPVMREGTLGFLGPKGINCVHTLA